MFEDVQPGLPDPMFILKKLADNDLSPNKVDLGVGVYRNEQSGYHELEAIKEAKSILALTNPGHDYELTTGDPLFVENASRVIFGQGSEAIQTQRAKSVQTISGTGANHLAALFLSRCSAFKDKQVFIGTPTWANYEPIFRLVGFEVVKYRYYDEQDAVVDFPTILRMVKSAAPNSVFVLQSCCHNPTGADLTREQWRVLAAAMKKSQGFPFFDIAYQGLGTSVDDDAYAIRLFTEMEFELVACQSFSKNFGLYGERCGVLHVVGQRAEVAKNIYDQLRCLIRWEFSSSPAYGSRLVNIVLEDERLTETWIGELAVMRDRLVNNRQTLYEALVNERKTPGDWKSIISTTGLFCHLPLSPQQCLTLRSKNNIYLPENGRINIAGLNPSNMVSVVSAIDELVKETSRS